MISFRQADLLPQIQNKVLYEDIWNYIRQTKGGDIPLVRLLRSMICEQFHIDAYWERYVSIKLPEKQFLNFELIPPEIRSQFMEWYKREGGSKIGEEPGATLRPAKYLMDDIASFYTGKKIGYQTDPE